MKSLSCRFLLKSEGTRGEVTGVLGGLTWAVQPRVFLAAVGPGGWWTALSSPPVARCGFSRLEDSCGCLENSCMNALECLFAAVLEVSVQWAVLLLPVTCFRCWVMEMHDQVLLEVTLAEFSSNARLLTWRQLTIVGQLWSYELPGHVKVLTVLVISGKT